MLETGMRPEGVYRVRREHVNLDAGSLYNRYGKTKAARRKIALRARALEVIARRVANAHDRTLRRSGVTQFRLYDLRHTWATRAPMSRIDLVTLAAMLGHSRIQMVLRYAHPTEEHQVQAMRKLESFMAARQIAEYEKKNKQSLQFPLQ